MGRTCYICSGPVTRSGTTGRYPRFCSPPCRRKARALRAQAARRDVYEAQAIRDRREFRAIFGLDSTQVVGEVPDCPTGRLAA